MFCFTLTDNAAEHLMMLCVIRKVEGYALHESGIVVRWQPI